MRYTYDTELLEDGSTINLISIGIVAEDGRKYYAVNSDADWDRIRKDDWLVENVWRHLPVHGMVTALTSIGQGKTANRVKHTGSLDTSEPVVKPKWVIRNEVLEFLRYDSDTPIELWAYFAAYDHVALAQLFGRMINLPKPVPMFTRDIKQLAADHPDVELPEQGAGAHNALADARHNVRLLTALGRWNG